MERYTELEKEDMFIKVVNLWKIPIDQDDVLRLDAEESMAAGNAGQRADHP